MDPDPIEYARQEDQEEAKAKSRLNTLVAIAVALLATFMGICKVKDDNIVQAMQQAQADKIDSYSWYQARNIREEVANAVAAQLAAQEAAAPQNVRAVYEAEIAKYQAIGHTIRKASVMSTVNSRETRKTIFLTVVLEEHSYYLQIFSIISWPDLFHLTLKYQARFLMRTKFGMKVLLPAGIHLC